MLLPIDIIAAILYWSVARATPDAAVPEAGGMALSVVVTMALALGAAEVAARLVRSHLVALPGDGARTRALTRGTITAYRAALVLVYIFQVQALGWPGPLEVPGSATLGAIVGLGPYLLTLTLSWLSFRRLDDLLMPGQWTARRYLVHRIRYTLFLLVPWFCIWIVLDLVGLLAPAAWVVEVATNPWLAPVAVLALLGVLLLFFPFIIVRLWGCEPIRDPHLRDRLDELQDRAGVRFGEIYRWDLGGGTILNGAVLGFIPPFRYLLLSRGLLERMDESELAGVVAHELGHVRYNHLFWHLFVTAAALTGLTNLLWELVPDPHLLAILSAAGIALYFRFVFGFLSRQYERQADLHALELLHDSRPLVQSLEKIAFLSGNVREARCWHHASVADRVAYLQAADAEPRLAREHHQRVRRVRAVVGSVAAILLAWSIIPAGMAASPSPDREESEVPRAEAEIRHWRRVLTLVPGDEEARQRLRELGASPSANRED
jgi:Zn-dependent protease with chaperone function